MVSLVEAVIVGVRAHVQTNVDYSWKLGVSNLSV